MGNLITKFWSLKSNSGELTILIASKLHYVFSEKKKSKKEEEEKEEVWR